MPQPISAGWLPSETKPSIDQVLTNSPTFLGFLETWVSRSAMWITLTPRSRASSPQPSRVVGFTAPRPVSLARLTSAFFTKCETRPGLAPWAITAVGPPRYFGASFSMFSRSA